MTSISFSKYHGAGNDFILVENIENKFDLSTKQIEFLCNRHFGIGADGLILLNKALNDNEQFSMRYFNSDGKESSMCGNGGRCITAFANNLKIIDKKAVFSALDGIHYAEVLDNKDFQTEVSLQMKDVIDVSKYEDDFILNTGSPHYVRFVKDVMSMNIVSEARKIRYNNKFKEEGINVNFVEITNDGIFVRTYERGVEDETLSCGTGVTASAICYSLLGKNINQIEINTLGGKLKVFLQKENNAFNNIILQGGATFVFNGTIKLPLI